MFVQRKKYELNIIQLVEIQKKEYLFMHRKSK